MSDETDPPNNKCLACDGTGSHPQWVRGACDACDGDGKAIENPGDAAYPLRRDLTEAWLMSLIKSTS